MAQEEARWRENPVFEEGRDGDVRSGSAGMADLELELDAARQMEESLAKLGLVEGGGDGERRALAVARARDPNVDREVEAYFDDVQDIIREEKYADSSSIVHVGHAARRKHVDFARTEKMSQTEVYVNVEDARRELLSCHAVVQTDGVVKEEGPEFSVTKKESGTQLMLGSADASFIAPCLNPIRVPDEVAAFSPPLPTAGAGLVEIVAGYGESAAPEIGGEGAGPGLPTGAVENGAFHGEAVDSELMYPMTPEEELDDELELQQNIILDAIQAFRVDAMAVPSQQRGRGGEGVGDGEGDGSEVARTLLLGSQDELALGGHPDDSVYVGPGSAYPEGGNYILTRDAAAFADQELADIVSSNLAAAEVDEEQAGFGHKSATLAEGDFALGGSHQPQQHTVAAARRRIFGNKPRKMVHLRHLDDYLVKEAESREIDTFLNEKDEERDVDELLAGKPQTAGLHDSFSSSSVENVQNTARTGVMSLDDTRFAGAEETLPSDPQLSGSADVEIPVGPSTQQGQQIADTLEKAGIIPEVLDKFTSTTSMLVYYGTGPVLRNGSTLTAEQVAAEPEVMIEGAFVMPGTTYALVLVDTDAERAVDGERLERLLWLKINIPGPQDIGDTGVIAAGTSLVEYEPPTAKSDKVHRYLYVLFRHKNNKFKVPADREAFSCRLFATVHGLTPIAAVNFTVGNAT